jgi:hypothetical protein
MGLFGRTQGELTTRILYTDAHGFETFECVWDREYKKIMM